MCVLCQALFSVVPNDGKHFEPIQSVVVCNSITHVGFRSTASSGSFAIFLVQFCVDVVVVAVAIR